MNRTAEVRDVTFVMSIKMHLFRTIQGVPYHPYTTIFLVLGRTMSKMAKMKGEWTATEYEFHPPKAPPATIIEVGVPVSVKII